MPGHRLRVETSITSPSIHGQSVELHSIFLSLTGKPTTHHAILGWCQAISPTLPRLFQQTIRATNIRPIGSIAIVMPSIDIGQAEQLDIAARCRDVG